MSPDQSDGGLELIRQQVDVCTGSRAQVSLGESAREQIAARAAPARRSHDPELPRRVNGLNGVERDEQLCLDATVRRSQRRERDQLTVVVRARIDNAPALTPRAYRHAGSQNLHQLGACPLKKLPRYRLEADVPCCRSNTRADVGSFLS